MKLIEPSQDLHWERSSEYFAVDNIADIVLVCLVMKLINVFLGFARSNKVGQTVEFYSIREGFRQNFWSKGTAFGA